MAEIAEIQLKIKAVEFALGSIARYVDEEQRKNHLRTQFDVVPNLDIYFTFSETELKVEKKQLQEKENLLLTLMQGNFFCVIIPF